MSKDGSSGLLSKMAKFVRNPRTDWADLESADAARSDREDAESKAQLREMLERKRQNDFVRKREFDIFRKLRSKEIDVPQALHSPSFFPSSAPAEANSSGGEQNTLEKIAAIEAQMASQWFSSQGASKASKREKSAPAEAAQSAPSVIDPTAFAPTQILDTPSSALQAQPSKTQPSKAQPPTPQPSKAQPSAPVGEPASKPSEVLLPMGMAPAYQSSQFEVAELVNNPEVEEIAILFANGETAAAEESLLRLISPTGGHRERAETWMALFDLYRATGQNLRFDEAGIEYAAVFGRSAPVWYSVPELLAASGAVGDEEESQANPNTSNWTANTSLSLQNLALLDKLPERVAPPWRLDWRYLKRIDPGCGQKLAQRLNAWSKDPHVKLRFVGVDNVLNLLEELTPVADTSVPQELWALRLAMLRILGMMEEFELNALNFCVTYELSPPSWEPACCECLQISPDGVAEQVESEAEQSLDWAATNLPTDRVSTLVDDESVGRAALVGQVLGDDSSQFDGLNAVGGVVESIEIECGHVQRVDFVAAGTLLNWVSDQQSKGRIIAFNNVNRLVAIFFRIIGIRELATVNVRSE